MKKLIVLITLIAGLNAAALAQANAKTPQQRADRLTHILQKQLNLSPRQAREVNAVLFAQDSQIDSLKSTAALNKKSSRAAAARIRRATRQNLFAIFSDAQKQQYLAWTKAKKEKQKETRQNEGADPNQ